MRVINLIVLLLAALLGISFSILNAKRVAVNYYLGTKELPLSILMLISLVIGVILGVLALAKPLIGMARSNSHLKKQVRQSEQEIENLRHIPIKDEH